MIRFKNTKKIINPKFLYALPVACIGVVCTQQTTNAMFKNPKLGMPLMATTGGRIVFEPPLRPPVIVETPPTKSSTTKTTDKLITISMVFPTSTSSSSALPRTPITSSKITRTNAGNLGNTLRGFGDEITSNTTSANITSLGSALRTSGDRFLQNQ